VIIRPVARSLSSRPIDKTVVPTDYFKTSLANLVFCYRRGDLVLLHLDFTGLSGHLTELSSVSNAVRTERQEFTVP